MKPEPKGDIVIHIDKKQYRAPKEEMTGAELRALAGITDKYDLWKKVPGGDDIKIGRDEVVVLKNGDHFYTAPSTLNPGAF